MKTKVNTMRAAGINFMHFRHLDETTGEVLPAGGATVAYKQQEDGSIVCAVSRCRNDELTGKHDNFNRKVGAAIAGGRVLKFINTHGKNKCAHVFTAHNTAEEFRAQITYTMAKEYAYVRDFQAKGLPAIVDLPVSAGSLARVQV
jgi:hypothetical protein